MQQFYTICLPVNSVLCVMHYNCESHLMIIYFPNGFLESSFHIIQGPINIKKIVRIFILFVYCMYVSPLCKTTILVRSWNLAHMTRTARRRSLNSLNFEKQPPSLYPPFKAWFFLCFPIKISENLPSISSWYIIYQWIKDCNRTFTKCWGVYFQKGNR